MVRPLLRQLKIETDGDVQKNIVRTLQVKRSKECTPIFIELLKRKDIWWVVQIEIIEELGNLKAKQAKEILKKYANLFYYSQEKDNVDMNQFLVEAAKKALKQIEA